MTGVGTSPPPYPGCVSDQPKILHLNDCADVARHLQTAAARRGHAWDYLPPAAVRPARVPANPWLAKAVYAPYVARRAWHVARADVVHVHYGTSARLLREPGIPRRPYVLTLHGTDIRELWLDPRYHDEIQRAVDGAAHVYFPNLDTVGNALAARPDAEFMPFFVEPAELPVWRPGLRRRVLFTSRWEPVKGGRVNIELARTLRAELPDDVELVGVDWGEDSALATQAGVRLLPRMTHLQFLDLVASAHVAIGQARPVIAVSEAETLAIGVPLAAVGSRLPRLDDGSRPPMIEGDERAVVAGILEALADPEAASRRLDGRSWALAHLTADRYIDPLLEVYARAAAEGVRG